MLIDFILLGKLKIHANIVDIVFLPVLNVVFKHLENFFDIKITGSAELQELNVVEPRVMSDLFGLNPLFELIKDLLLLFRNISDVTHIVLLDLFLFTKPRHL